MPPRRGPLDLPELRLDRRGGKGCYRTFRAAPSPPGCPGLPRRAAPRRARRGTGAGSCRAGGDWRPAGPSTWPRAAGRGRWRWRGCCVLRGFAKRLALRRTSKRPRAPRCARVRRVCGSPCELARPHGRTGSSAPSCASKSPPRPPGPPPEVCGCRSATPPDPRITAGWGHSGRPRPARRVGDGPSPRARGGWSARLGVRARCGFWAMVGLSRGNTIS